MINFSAMQGPLVRPLRWLVHALPPQLTVRVLQGPLRGTRWIAGAATAGCWLGSYEAEVQHQFAAITSAGDVVYDIGANVGFFTLLAGRLVGAAGRVYAFEPIPNNVDILRRHIAMNELQNVEVVEAAASDRSGWVMFGGAGTTSHADPAGHIRVRATALDDLWREGRIQLPSVVKLDIEGAELAALRGMRAVIAAACPRLLIEFHGARVDGQDADSLCLKLLEELGYHTTVLSCGETLSVPNLNKTVPSLATTQPHG